MRSVLLATSGLAALAAAGTISVPISKQQSTSHRDAIARRADSDNSFVFELINNITGRAYYAEFGVGTPAQTLSFLVDTGSSDTWVNSDDTDFCTKGGNFFGQTIPPNCLPQFDRAESSTFEIVSRDFRIKYLDGSTASGLYFNDTVTIGDDAVIKNQQLGLATVTSHPTGLMGLGMQIGVASRNKYPTVLDNLVSQGVIDTPKFSLYLDSLTQDKGSILFGGIDTKKYVGSLALLPLRPDTLSGLDNVTSYAVHLDGFSVDGIEHPDLNTSAIFDTGSTLTALPESVVDPIFDHFGVVTFMQIPTPFIDCKFGGKDYSDYKFHFVFDGVNITVPLKELVINAFEDFQDDLKQDPLLGQTFQNLTDVCMFGIANGGSFFQEDAPEYALLGDTFLRSAYVVYDLADQQLGLAQAYLRSDESNIVTLTANSSIPDLKGMDAPRSEDDDSNTDNSNNSGGNKGGSGNNNNQNNKNDDEDSAAGILRTPLSTVALLAAGLTAFMAL